MARPVWTGHITFGLVNVPVVLYSAERRTDLSLKMIDSKNDAHIRYERINDETGEEVPWNRIVKGYEYDGGNLVLLSDEELERASPELTRTIDVTQFVEADEIDPIYYDKPYYLIPGKGGAKGYVLLRDALSDSERVGLATVVIRTRQYVAALRPYRDGLLLQLMRYHQELRDIEDFDMPETELRRVKSSKQERDMARQLIDGMTDKWNPKEFHDEYHDAVMKMIKDKIASGQTEPVDLPDDEETEEEPATINFLEVLRRSVESRSGKSKSPSRKKAKRSSKKRPAAKSSQGSKSKSKKTSKKKRAS